MRESMAHLTPRFSANRSVREYTEQQYLPAASAYRERAANKGSVGRRMIDWKHRLDEKWTALHFGDLKVLTKDDQRLYEVQVYLNDLAPMEVRVELTPTVSVGSAPIRQEMKCLHPLIGASGGYVYGATVAAIRPHTDYTPRVVPRHDDAKVPLEDARILWQR